jgi:hypothetical protein
MPSNTLRKKPAATALDRIDFAILAALQNAARLSNKSSRPAWAWLLPPVAVRDTDHLRGLVIDRLAARTEVGHLLTSILFEHVRSPGLPILAAD